jgi:hypothetical protein
MPIEFLQYISGLYLWLIAVVWGWLVSIFVLHFFVPKVLLSTYFKEPYFSPAEIVFFTGLPFAYMRTAMFIRLAGWPNSGKKRGITESEKLTPSWFRHISKILIWIMLAIAGALAVTSVILVLGLCVSHDHC